MKLYIVSDVDTADQVAQAMLRSALRDPETIKRFKEMIEHLGEQDLAVAAFMAGIEYALGEMVQGHLVRMNEG